MIFLLIFALGVVIGIILARMALLDAVKKGDITFTDQGMKRYHRD